MAFVPLILALLCLPTVASGQIYRWVDEQGQVHFESRPRPGAERVEVRPQVVERDAATRERQARTGHLHEVSRQERQEAEQTARKQREQREQSCQTWRDELETLSRGGRFFYTDAKGERVYYSEQEIGGARQRLAERIASDCG